MSRSGVLFRAVRLDDVDELVDLWQPTPARGAGAESIRADVQSSVRKVLASDRERIVVAQVSGSIAGGIHLRLAPLMPLASELAVFTSHLTVHEQYRRRGVARGLMDAAVTWAEENGVPHVVSLSAVNSRDSSRFMARLGLTQAAVVRVAPTSLVRSRLTVDRPGLTRQAAGQRPLGQVLAARRSLRRSQQGVL